MGTVPACLGQFGKVHGADNPTTEQHRGLGVSATSWGLGVQLRRGAVCPARGGQGGADPQVTGLGMGQGWGHAAVG